MQVPTHEVIDVMIDGGERLCDYATDQWLSGKYDRGAESSDAMQKENLQRWSEIRKRIRRLGRELKQMHPE
jgi:hypothetical protein